MKNKGFLLFVSLQEFFSDILKKNTDGELDFKLGECFILICSRDVTTDVVRQRGYGGSFSKNDFQSKYNNVEFITTLLPSVDQMEYATSTGIDTFVEQYTGKLYGEDQMRDIISICDVVANRDTPVFVLSTGLEFRSSYPYILKDFIKDEFGLIGYTMDDLEGKPIDTIYDIGDKDKIAESIKEHIDSVLRQYDKEYFFNTLMDDMEKACRDIMNSKSEEELRTIAKSKSIFISRRDTKERIVEKIIEDIVG